jgi:hypothetical protein
LVLVLVLVLLATPPHFRYGAWTPTWRPVWSRVHQYYTLLHQMTPEFFALSVGVAGTFPWFQHGLMPQYIEILDGTITIELKLASTTKLVSLARASCGPAEGVVATPDDAGSNGGGSGGSGGSGGGGQRSRAAIEMIGRQGDQCRAQFPDSRWVQEWRVAPPSSGPVFFALAWADASRGAHGDRFGFLSPS